MPKPSHAAAALAVLLLAAQPCAAADDLRDTSAAQRRTAPFAGVGLSLPLGGPAKASPSARLQFTAARPAGGTFARAGAAPGLELGLAQAGKPTLYIGGRSTAELDRRLNLGGSKGTILVVAGAVVLLVLLAAAVADAQPTPGPDEDAFD
ncbi:MAG TPA: hypothetical protein VF650_08960 [Allosphingosinicella sp.]|jgi:hypothetical protein